MIQENNQKKPSVTVGIPAYNEEANIKYLIEALIKQNDRNFTLKEIIIADDCSNDNTVKEARSINDSRVLVLTDQNRSGQYFRQNQILDNFDGDILVLMNADVLPADNDTIANLVDGFKSYNVGLVAGKIVPLPPTNFFERVINYSVKIKDYISSNYNGGHNILTCKGAYRGFSKKFLEKFRFQRVVNEDAYTYLWCISNNFEFEFAKNSVVLFRSPGNFNDHKRQSLRFIQGQEGLIEYFGRDMVVKAHRIPKAIMFRAAIKYFIENPILFVSYFYLYCKIRLFKNGAKEAAIIWNTAQSTKHLVSNTDRKIQIICTYFHPVLAGLEINILNTYSYFVKQGWHVIVSTTKDDVGKRNIYGDYDEVNGIKITRRSYFSYAFFPFSLGIDYKSTGILALHDFVTFPGIFICFYTLVLKTLNTKKYTLVLTSHGLFSYGMLGIYPGIKMKIKKFIDSTLGVYLINRSVDKIRTVSEQEKGQMVKAGVRSDLIEVIGNGIEEIAFKQDMDQSVSDKVKNFVDEIGNYAVELARIDPLKNLATLIRSFASIDKDIKLVIVGPEHSKAYKDELVKLILDLGLKNRIIFTGQVTGIDKYYILKNSRVFVHLPKAEGFGNVVHEAMSQGCVCVVSKGTALEELIRDGENGFLVDPTDPIAIAAKINFIINSPNRQAMKQKNIQLTRNHSWSDIAKKVERLYLDLKPEIQ